jgi:phage baseplate assembly protein W
MARKNRSIDTTISFSSVGEKLKEYRDRNNVTPHQPLPIGIKTPLSLKNSGLFEMHYDLENQIKDNFRNLLLTNKGERLGNPVFGADLRKTQYSVSNKEEATLEIMSKVQDAVSKFMPFINLLDFKTSEIRSDKIDRDSCETGPGGQLLVRITYSIPQVNGNVTGLQLILPMGV